MRRELAVGATVESRGVDPHGDVLGLHDERLLDELDVHEVDTLAAQPRRLDHLELRVRDEEHLALVDEV